MSEFSTINLEIKGRLARLMMNNPPDNFLTHQMMGEIEAALEVISTRMDILVLILSSIGNNFSSGLDYSEHKKELTFSLLERFHSICESLTMLEIPTMAVVNGRTKNWACDLLYFFDYVIASEDSIFVYDNLALGTFPPVGVFLLNRNLGDKKVFKILMQGSPFDAHLAKEANLITDFAPKEQLIQKANEALSIISSKSIKVSAVMLKHLRKQKEEILSLMTEDSFYDYLNLLPDFEDYREGLAAWREKRSPKWKHS